MALVNIFSLFFLLSGLWRGIRRGLIKEVASLISLVAGIFGALYFSHIIEDYLINLTGWEKSYTSIAAFITTFFCIRLAIRLIAAGATGIINLIFLKSINKIAGGILGITKALIIIGFLIFILDQTNNIICFFNEAEMKRILLYQPTRRITTFVTTLI